MLPRVRGLAVILLICAAAACGAAAPAPAQEVSAGDAQDGKTVTVHVGDTLRLTLGNTAWTIAGSSDSSVLEQQGEQVVSPAARGTCYPGMGCGTTTAVFKALKKGSASVTATRVSCGEARRCVGAEGQYALTVAVS